MPTPLIDLTGMLFGKLRVKGRSKAVSGRSILWNCTCICGATRAVRGTNLRRGNSKSCGCVRKERMRAVRTTHGMSGHSAYVCWRNIMHRCSNPANKAYAANGGRGIKISPDWPDFAAFWRDMGSTWYSGCVISRLDIDGDYTAANCRWVTLMEKGCERKSNVVIDTPRGPLTVTQAGRIFKLPPSTIFSRIRYGWAEGDLLIPLHKYRGRSWGKRRLNIRSCTTST